MTESATALGIDVGGTNLRIAEIDAAGRILSRHAERVTNGREAFPNRLAELVASYRSPSVKAIGIGIPGRVNAAAGLVLSAGYLDIGGLPLAAWLGATTGLPVVVENDCSMALIAECSVGAARGAENVVMFTIGTGIGGAIVQGGRPLARPRHRRSARPHHGAPRRRALQLRPARLRRNDQLRHVAGAG